MLIVGLLTRQPNVRELIIKTDKWCLLTNIIISVVWRHSGLCRPPNCQTSQSRLESWWCRAGSQSPHGKHYQQTSSETVNMNIYVRLRTEDEGLKTKIYYSRKSVLWTQRSGTAPSWCLSLNTQHCDTATLWHFDTVTANTCSILKFVTGRVWSCCESPPTTHQV